ncbi:MAG: class IV adenylate cyclase [Anaerolineales bacterium]
MSNSNQEIEAKFYVTGLDGIKQRLHELEAHLIQERILETNIRFDLPDARLRSQGRVLRLRRDTEAKLTYKGGSRNENGVLRRTEIEFTVGDFDKAQQFLEALGYQELLRYDKYREVYGLDDCHIMLDQLPYGYFVEIEGKNVASIQQVTARLNLKWDAAVSRSYNALFDSVKAALRLKFNDLSYENFEGVEVKPEHLGVTPADLDV